MVTKKIAWQTGSGNITLTYQGQGDGPVTVQSDVNGGDARSQIITIETTKGSPATAKNLTIRQSACPVPVGTVLNYAYTGSYQEIELPAGQYKLQCWGAQGGSNAAASAYGITEKAGGKGGYSEGIITLSSKTKVRVYVGGVGTSSAGGWNGGGSTSGTTQRNADSIFGYCKMGGGGGATDIRLSDGALLSRMIVAGGGSGGAMAYKAVTSTVPRSETVNSLQSANWWINGNNKWEKDAPTRYYGTVISCGSYRGATFTLSTSNNTKVAFLTSAPNSSTQNYSTPDWASGWSSAQWANNTSVFTVPSNANYVYIELCVSGTQRGVTSCTYTWSETVVNTETKGQVGFAGGGINGIVYSSAYNIYSGKQNEAGYGGEFGFGRDVVAQTVRYSAGAGGGGWYGGGTAANDSDITVVLNSGGGSGFVNTAANAQYRPSGYTGLQLDSGETKAGNTSFPSTSGGTETGHSGNGYARITRLS